MGSGHSSSSNESYHNPHYPDDSTSDFAHTGPRPIPGPDASERDRRMYEQWRRVSSGEQQLGIFSDLVANAPFPMYEDPTHVATWADPGNDCPPGSIHGPNPGDTICHAQNLAAPAPTPAPGTRTAADIGLGPGQLACGISDPNRPTTVHQRQCLEQYFNVDPRTDLTSVATRSDFTPVQTANLAETLLVNGIQVAQTPGFAGALLNGNNNAAPAQHDRPPIIPATQADVAYEVHQQDMRNLIYNVGGDAGASRDDWHGNNATVAGVQAHNLRMETGTPRGRFDTGAPPQGVENALMGCDLVPFAGTFCRAGQTISEAVSGNPHVYKAQRQFYFDWGADMASIVGGEGLRYGVPGIKAAYTGISAATRAGMTIAEKVSAEAAIDTTGIELVDTARILASAAGGAGESTAEHVGVEIGEVGSRGMGGGRVPDVRLPRPGFAMAEMGAEGAAKNAVDLMRGGGRGGGGVVIAAESNITREAEALAGKELEEFTFKEAEKNAATVTRTEAESALEAAKRQALKAKKLAHMVAFDTGVNAIGSAIVPMAQAQIQGLEMGLDLLKPKPTDDADEEPGDGDGYGDEPGHEPLPNGKDPGNPPPPSTHPHDHKPDQHNMTRWGHDTHDADRSKRMQVTHDLLGSSGVPSHAHQSGDMSNALILGGLALGGALIYARA